MKFSDRNPADSADPSAVSIKELALEWISRRDAGLTANEETEFQAWLESDPRHVAVIAAFQPTWSKLNRVRHLGRGNDLRYQVTEVLARKARRRFAVRMTSLAAAATIAFAIFLSRPASEADRLSPTVVMRANRQLLPDGSSIDLNVGAEVASEFTSETRSVRLVQGEALFHVAKDPARPFVVSAGPVAVRAVGTAFAVRLEPDAVDVLVTQGRVAVEKKTGERQPMTAASEGISLPGAAEAESSAAVISASAMGDVSSSGLMVDAGRRVSVPMETMSIQSLAPRLVSSGEVATSLAWRNRRVEFNGTSLAEAFEIFNRVNALQISAANPETGAIQITGVFWTNDPEAFSRALETSLAVRATREIDGKITFRK